jgi:hypothetical protein
MSVKLKYGMINDEAVLFKVMFCQFTSDGTLTVVGTELVKADESKILMQ